MKRAALALLVIPLVCGDACARGSAAGFATAPDAPVSRRTISVGDGITVRAARALLTLPQGQSYRFVPPESLATGLAADDVESVSSEYVVAWRAAFSKVMTAGQWTESADAPRYDVTIFSTSRMKRRVQMREDDTPVTSPLPTCDAMTPVTALPPCSHGGTSARVVRPVDVWDVEYHTYHVLRRRSDGAVRVWRRAGLAGASDRTGVAIDLRQMLASHATR